MLSGAGPGRARLGHPDRAAPVRPGAGLRGSGRPRHPASRSGPGRGHRQAHRAPIRLRPLADKSTLNRLEHAPTAAPARYHKIGHAGAMIERLFVDLLLDAYAMPPEEIVLDLDATDDPLHGSQEGRQTAALSAPRLLWLLLLSPALRLLRRPSAGRHRPLADGARARGRAGSGPGRRRRDRHGSALLQGLPLSDPRHVGPRAAGRVPFAGYCPRPLRGSDRAAAAARWQGSWSPVTARPAPTRASS